MHSYNARAHAKRVPQFGKKNIWRSKQAFFVYFSGPEWQKMQCFNPLVGEIVPLNQVWRGSRAPVVPSSGSDPVCRQPSTRILNFPSLGVFASGGLDTFFEIRKWKGKKINEMLWKINELKNSLTDFVFRTREHFMYTDGGDLPVFSWPYWTLIESPELFFTIQSVNSALFASNNVIRGERILFNTVQCIKGKGVVITLGRGKLAIFSRPRP